MPLVHLSKVRVEIFRHPGGELVLDTIVPFAPGDTALALDLPVVLRTPGERFRLRISAYDDNDQVVFGSDEVVAATPNGVPTPPTTMTLAYVGADTVVAALSVAPRDTVLTVNHTFSFRSVAKKSDSTVVAAQVGWTSRDTTVIGIDRNTGLASARAEGANVWIIASTLNGVLDSTRVTLTQPVGSVELTPATPSVIHGRTLQMTATVKDGAGVSLPSRPVSWSSTNPGVATVSNTGLVSGVTVGTTTISASSGGVTGSVTLSVIDAPVFRVLVMPAPDTTMFVGDQFAARARVEDDLGNVLPGRSVVWASSAAGTASVDPSSGRVTGVGSGTASIVATSEGKSGSTTVNVVRAGASLIVASATGVFGSSTELSATLSSRGSGVANRVVTFSVNGVGVGSAPTDGAGVARLANVSLAGINAGTYSATGTPPGVEATFAGDAGILAVSGTASLTVTRASATLTLGALSHSYDGSPKQVTVTTTPAGLAGVSVTYAEAGGTPTTTPPSAAGSYTVRATLVNANYQAADVTGTMTISSVSQTITFAALPPRTYGEPPFAVTASASSGLPVTYSANGVCTVSGNLVTLTGAGSCAITATQPGDRNYSAAVPVVQSFAVDKATATITLGGLNHVYDGTPKSATFTTGPPGLTTVSLAYSQGGVAVAAPTNAGSYLVSATLDNPSYVGQATGTLVISAATQSIDYPPIPSRTFGDPPFTLVATASSGLPVTFVVAYGPCSVSGSTVTITGAGSCAINAMQAGNANYAAAPTVGQVLTIAKAAATIVLSDLTQTYDATPKPATVVTSPAGLTVVTTTYDGSTTAPINAGSYAVSATLANADYHASPVSGTLVITKAPTTLMVASASGPFEGTASLSATLSRSGTPLSNSSVAFTLNGTAAGSAVTSAAGVAAIASAPLTGIPAGSYPGGVVASFGGDANHLASSGSGALSVGQGNASVTLGNLSQTYDGTARAVTASTVPAGLSVAITYDGGSTAPTNAGSYAVAATITDPNYVAATATGTLLVAKGNPTVRWNKPSDIVYGTALGTTQLNATAIFTGGGPVVPDVSYPPLAGTFTYSPPAGTVLGAGASQTLSVLFTPQDPNLNSATGAVSINVLPASQTITFAALPDRLDNEPDFALSATASSGLAVSFAASGGACVMASAGVVDIVSAGTCTITASQPGNSNYLAAPEVSQTFTIRSAITRTAVNPRAATLTSLNDSLQLSAQSYRDTVAAAGSHTWVSRNPAIATVSASGLVVAVNNGVTYVVVTEAGGTRDSAQITVQQQVSTVTVTPASRTLYLGTTFQFSAAAVDGRGNAIAGVSFAWSSTAPAVATPDGNGLVTTSGLGSASIRATAGGIIGTSAVTVITAIQRIAVTPDTLTLTSLGLQRQYSAVAYDTLNAPMTGISFVWSSTNPSVAPVDSFTATSARVTSAANGVTSIQARAQGVTGSASLKVQQVLNSVEVTPSAASIAPSGTIALVARGRDANGRYIAGGSFTWSSSNTAIATVSASGVVTGVAVGTVNIFAASGGITSAAPAVITVANSVPPVISFGRDTLTVGRASSLSIPVFLSTPSATPVTVNLSARDTVAFFSTATITFPANVTSVNATLSGRNAGTTQVYAVDSGGVYAADTAVVAVQATVKLAVTAININATDSYSTQVLLSDPSPAGGTYVSFAYTVAGIASISPDPAFIPAGQLAADIIVRGDAPGSTTITPTAQGVNGTSTTFNAAVAKLTFSVTTRLLGQGQYHSNDYLTTPRNQNTALRITMSTADTLVTRLPTLLTIPGGTYYVYFTNTSVAKGRTTTIASSAGWAPDTFTTIVTTPRAGICCGAALTTTSPTRTVTVYAEDSVGTAHPRSNSLVVSLSSSDTTVIKLLDTVVTIAAGSSSNNSARLTPVGGGDAWVRTSAGGHASDSVKFTVTAPKVSFSFTSTILGAGQQNRNVYLQVPNNVTAPLTVTLINPDTTVAYTPASVTIPTGSYYAYFSIRAHTPAAPMSIRATAPGYSPDTATIRVTTPRVTSCCSATINNFSGARTFNVYAADSLNTSHETIAPLTVTLSSSDTTKIKIDSTSVTIAAGTSLNNKARIRPVGEGSAKIYVTAPNGYVDSLTVYTVVRPKLSLSFLNNYIGRRQQTSNTGVYVTTPDTRTESLHVSIEHKQPTVLRHIVSDASDRDTSLTIPPGTYYRYFGYAGLGNGRDTIIVRAPGYIPDTAFVTVTSPKFTSSGIPATATTTSPVQTLYVYAADSLGTAHLSSDTIVIRAVSSDTTVIKPESAYYRLPAGASNKATRIRFVGAGSATMTYSDTAGVYLPVTTGAVTVSGPSLRMSAASTVLGMRQNTGSTGRYVYTDNNVTTPLVVRLTSSNTRVATVPDSVIIPAGTYYAYFRVTAHDTLGTIQLQATATGYFAVTSTVQVTAPKFIVSTDASVYTTTPPQIITVYAADANGTTHFVNDTVRVMLSSSAPTVAAPDSASVSILPNASYTQKAKMQYGVVGTTQLSASDTTTALYRYDPATANVAVNTPPLTFSFVSASLGVGQYFDPYLSVPHNVTSPLKIALSHVGAAKVSVPDTVTISTAYYVYFRPVAMSSGIDTIIATAAGHKPDTAYVTVGAGRVDPIAGWPASMTVGQIVGLTLYARDPNGAGRNVAAATTFSLTPSANIAFYSDAAATIPITSVTVAANASSAPTFYVKALTSGTGSVTITNADYATYTPTTSIP